jgi:hypothetical protein
MIRVAVQREEIIESEWVEAIELGRIMLEGYLEEYGEDEQWDFIATEKTGRVIIPSIGNSERVLYVYTYDGVYRDLSDGDIKLLETKTAAAISTGHLSLDDQAGSYWATASAELRKAGTLGSNGRISGITYNFLRKALPDDRPRHPVTGERCNKPTKQHYIDGLTQAGVNVAKSAKLEELEQMAEDAELTVYGEVSKSQPTPNFLRHFVTRTTRERNTQIRRIADESQHMAAIRNGTLPITKTPRATGHDACRYGCEFFQMCELQEAGADWEQYKEHMYRVRDPYEGYEIKSAHTES